jgi:hypothetical protein
MPRRALWLVQAVVLAGLWLVVAINGFDPAGVLIAVLVSARIVGVEWKVFALLMARFRWAPSKDPADYR